MPNPFKFSIENKGDAEAVIYMYDDIGPSWTGLVGAAALAKEFETLQGKNKLKVRINSKGGDVFEGVTIYNLLKEHPAHVTVYIDGMAASIASLIAMAGDEIVIAQNARMMVHKPSAKVAGGADDLREMADLMDDVEANTLVGAYASRTGMDAEKITELLAAETHMSAQEAFDMGFVTSISDNKGMSNRGESGMTDGTEEIDNSTEPEDSDRKSQHRKRELDLANLV